MEKIIGKNAKGEVKVYNVAIRNFTPDYRAPTGYIDIEGDYLPNYPEVAFPKNGDDFAVDSGTLVYVDTTSNVDDFVEWVVEEFDDPTKIHEYGTKYWTHEDGVNEEATAEMDDAKIAKTVVFVEVTDPDEDEMKSYEATVADYAKEE